LQASDAQITAALIAAIASLATSGFTLIATVLNTPVKYWLEQKSLKSKLSLEYEHSQRARIRDLIAKYRGLALEAAESVDHRFWNLYKNDPDRWLDVTEGYPNAYYFHSWLYRLMKLLTIARAFEQEALFIDPRLAGEDDYDFVHLLKSWSWAICDVSLFEGIDYDHSTQRDHIFRDNLLTMCEPLWLNGNFITRDRFKEILAADELLRPICRLFSGLRSDEQRLRWDRLVCLHLLVLVFLSQFGYSTQRPSDTQINQVLKHMRHENIRRNLQNWLPRLGLTKSKEGKRLLDALSLVTATTTTLKQKR
jgi:hypothetical protein